ncbi:hypothetical protein ACXHWJ_10100 [Alcaligenes nematophilus]|uniref:hypothetical protein n=1 Tax=Alcaligenes nematophilus TaxID=2994643 RepID=UPI00384DD300
MNAKHIIEEMGGRRAVLRITGLSKGRISQWEKAGVIPRVWQLVFHHMNPVVPAPAPKESSRSI